MAGSVDAGDVEGVRRNLGSVNFGLGQFFGESERDTAGSGADINEA